MCGPHRSRTARVLTLQGASPSRDLYRAARSGDVAGVTRALERGADINYRNGADQHTPLMASAKRGHAEVVRTLLLRGAADLRALVSPYTLLFSGSV